MANDFLNAAESGAETLQFLDEVIIPKMALSGPL